MRDGFILVVDLAGGDVGVPGVPTGSHRADPSVVVPAGVGGVKEPWIDTTVVHSCDILPLIAPTYDGLSDLNSLKG